MKSTVRLFIVNLLIITGSHLHAGEFNSVISIDDPLPAFENLPATDGKHYSSADFSKDILVLVSLSNVCPFSNGIQSDLMALVDQFKGESVDIVGANYNINKYDTMDAMKERAQAVGFNFVYLRDESQALGRQLGTTVTPEFFVFDKERKLIYTGLLHNSPAMEQGEGKVAYLRGEPKDFYVADAISASLEGKAIETKETKPYGCSVEYLNVN